MNENPLQGSFVIEELTDLVEEAVLAEFDRIAERGGVLGAMETGYQRGRIQDESMLYEQRKHDGSLPIVGVNTFVRPSPTPRPRRSSSPGRPRRRSRASSTGSRTSTPATPPTPRPRCAACRTWPPATATCSTS
jgi:methylmalonyl-CoA mutase N-terminal domain/subunit